MFNKNSSLYPLRWMILIGSLLLIGLCYANYTGWRLFASNNQQSWSASGPGQHK